MVGVVKGMANQMTEPADQTRAGVSWAGAGQPIVLQVHGAHRAVDVPLTPVRALELAKELVEPSIQLIKHSQWGPNWPG